MNNLKKYFLLIVILINAEFYAQNTLEVIVPQRTYHFDRSNLAKYVKGEGGSIGVLLNYTINNDSKFKTNIIAGVYENSFGNYSKTLMYGKTYFFNKNLSLTLSLGFATNYQKAYEVTYYVEGEKFTKDSSFLKNNFGSLQKDGIIPVYLFATKYVIKKGFGVILSANHIYANFGFVVDLNRMFNL